MAKVKSLLKKSTQSMLKFSKKVTGKFGVSTRGAWARNIRQDRKNYPDTAKRYGYLGKK